MDPIKLERRREKKRKAAEIDRIMQHKAQNKVKSIIIRIDWTRGTYGNTPHARANVCFKDGTSGSFNGYTAGGCGYDKESTVIAAIFNDFLRYKIYRKRAGETPYGIYNRQNMPDWNIPSFNGGVGTSCYYSIADYIGGQFKNVESGKRYDIFKYTDKRAPGRKLPAESDPFGPLKGLMALGALMADTPEQKNRNDKAALAATPGLNFPDDWDTLDEKEKTRRLEGVKEVLK